MYQIPIYKISLVRDGNIPSIERRKSLHSSTECIPILQQYLKDLDREHFVILLLDSKNKLIGINTVSIGCLDLSVVHPREVIKAAILSNAGAVIFAHNHPSGDPSPSQEDIKMTRRLQECFDLFGIKILDHIIIGEDSQFVSFFDTGLLNK